jgi:5-methylcytosine-specific restriction endonuclease McrA
MGSRTKYDSYLRSKTWQRVRARAFATYGRKCARCPSTKRLHVHHKTYVRMGSELMEDLEILCEPCHVKEHQRDQKAQHRKQPVTTVRKSKASKLANRRNRRYEASNPPSPANVEWLAEVRAKLGRT